MSAADNRAAYDAIAAQWLTARTQLGALEREVLDAFVLGLPSDARILDLGCGTGRPIAEWLLQRGFRVTGVDQSSEMLAQARQLFPAGDWRLARIEDFTSEERFEAVIAWDSLFHIPRKRVPEILERVAAILAPGGRFTCTLGGSAHPAFTDEMFGVEFFYDSPPPDESRALLRELGFVIERETMLNQPDGQRDKGRVAFVATTTR
jgi:2-polyprenyl-3-methyl-5-hydroxy-6-metoxy-1,4-benzoquinol methylase